MLNNSSKNIKYRRVLFFYDELTRHRVDYETALGFMEYIFGVSRGYLVQIIKGCHKYDEDTVMEHRDVDIKTIEVYVQKLYRDARDKRQVELKFENN